VKQLFLGGQRDKTGPAHLRRPAGFHLAASVATTGSAV
jgi:hypothetical protein